MGSAEITFLTWAMYCQRCLKQIIASSVQDDAFDDDFNVLIRRDGTRVSVTPQLWKLLTLLRRAHPRTAEKGYLEDELWTHLEDLNSINLLNVYVCKLRRRMEGTGWRILNLWGSGYRLEQGEWVFKERPICREAVGVSAPQPP